MSSLTRKPIHGSLILILPVGKERYIGMLREGKEGREGGRERRRKGGRERSRRVRERREGGKDILLEVRHLQTIIKSFKYSHTVRERGEDGRG